jgi:hypothetical protein
MICGLTNPPPLSYESHITIEPVEGERLDDLERLCKQFKFKVAALYMIKDRQITNERSNRDTFCTGWGDEFEELELRTCYMVNTLRDNGFSVWRYKIEQTLVDVRLS